jgi:cation:H+ antiporter
LYFGLFLFFAGTFTTRKREVMNVVFLLFTTLVLSFHIIIGFVSPIVIVLTLLYLTYLFYLAKFQEKELLGEEKDVVDLQKHSIQISFFYLILSFVGLYLGARFVIYSVEGAGAILSIPTAYLTLTTISIATSLPELAVTITSARKKEYIVAIGNILGTNVMNVCLILGLSGIFGTYSINTSLYIYSMIFFILGTLIFSYLVLRKKFTPFWGYIFLTMYIFYFGIFLI